MNWQQLRNLALVIAAIAPLVGLIVYVALMLVEGL